METITFLDIAELSDVQKGILFCRKYKILPSDEPKDCDVCFGKDLVVPGVFNEKPNFPYIFRCKYCRRKVNITTNTWFEGCRFSINKNIQLIYCWLRGMTIEKTNSELGLSVKTVGDYFSYCREVCYVICTNSSEPIGGPGETVELDESYITTTKFNKRKVLRSEMKQIWIFGGIEKQSKKFFILRVYGRDKYTIVNVIKHFVLPGSRISTNGWKTYSELQEEGYIPDLTKHSIKVTTNEDSGSERVWKSLKETMKTQGRPGICDDTYIFQYLYLNQLKSRNYKHPSEQLPVFLRDIGKVYTGFGGTNLLPKSVIVRKR